VPLRRAGRASEGRSRIAGTALTIALIATSAASSAAAQSQRDDADSWCAASAWAVTVDSAGDVETPPSPVASPDGDADRRDRLIDQARELFHDGVDDEHAVERGSEIIDLLHADPCSGSRGALILAYDGAFRSLRAKHGHWPPARLRDVRAGLARLDAAVILAPSDLEVRYLRLVNTLFLPRLFGRAGTARSDMAALACALPHEHSDHSPAFYRRMVDFVLVHGDPCADCDELQRAPVPAPGVIREGR
jgi:hypothetical protein